MFLRFVTIQASAPQREFSLFASRIQHPSENDISQGTVVQGLGLTSASLLLKIGLRIGI
jgi:hypothetical protein